MCYHDVDEVPCSSISQHTYSWKGVSTKAKPAHGVLNVILAILLVLFVCGIYVFFSSQQYDIAFLGLQLAAMSFVPLFLAGIRRRVGAYMLVYGVLKHVCPTEYQKYLQADYETQRRHNLSIDLTLIGLSGLMAFLAVSVLISRSPALPSHMVKSLCNAFAMIWIVVSSFIFVVYFLLDFILTTLKIPGYSVFKDQKEYLLSQELRAEIFKKALSKRIPIVLCCFALVVASILFIETNVLTLSITLLPLLVVLSHVLAESEGEYVKRTGSSRTLLQTRISICAAAIAGGPALCAAFFLIYYMFPWVTAVRFLSPVSNTLFVDFSLRAKHFIALVWLFPILTLIFYVGFCLFVVRFVPRKDRGKFRDVYLTSPIKTTLMSILFITIARIFYLASQSLGEPSGVIVQAIYTIFEADSILGTLATALSVLLIRDYYNLVKSLHAPTGRPAVHEF